MNNNISTRFNSAISAYELNINGKVFSSSEEGKFTIPLSVIEDININEFPTDVTLEIEPDNLPEFRDDFPFLPRINNTSGKNVYIDFNFCPDAKYVSGYPIGYPHYQEALIDLLLLNKKLRPKILANEFDGETFHFHCSIELPKDSIGNLFNATFKFFYTARLSVLKESKEFPATLRKKLKLSIKPSRRAKVQLSNDGELSE